MAIAKNPKVIMTSDEYIRRLKVIASRNTFYKNLYPYNLCYNYANGVTSADCSNLVKAILNGYDVNNRSAGYYQRDLSNTGDCTEAELLAQCSDVSQNFKQIVAPEILYMKGHIGTYIGITPDNRFNVIECTTAWGGGVIYSWVDQDGTRRRENGGSPIILKDGTYQRWTHHGKPTLWVSYSGQTMPQNAPQGSNSNGKPKVDISNKPMLKKGNTGESVRELQKLLSDKGYNPYGDFGNACDDAVRKFQREHTDVNGKKLEVDGIVGAKTWGALYK